MRAHAVREKDGELFVLGQSFFYEKIYPKWTKCRQKSNNEAAQGQVVNTGGAAGHRVMLIHWDPV